MKIAAPAGDTAWYLEATPAAVSAWLVWLRRAAAAIDALLVVLSVALPSGTFPLRRLAPLIAASALLHAEQAVRTSGQRGSRFIDGGALVLQTVVLTGLLELSGGPSNPFSVVYVVSIALAALTLGSGWAYVVGASSVVCYALLISWHLEELVPAHHRLIDFPTHLFTMWFAIIVVLTGYGSIATAVESAKLGATTYLTKPVDADQILAAFNDEAATGDPARFAVPSLARVEWEHIQRVLADCGGNLSQAARALGIHRRSLQRKLSKDPVPESR